MSLKQAIQNRDEAELIKTVKEATKMYKADQPKEVNINTVYGDIPFSMVFDEDTKWNIITSAYVDVIQQVDRIPEGADKDVEIAKIIATNPVLRSVGAKATKSSGLL